MLFRSKFVMPFNSQTFITSAILKVSDGRPDVVLTNANKDANKILTFSAAGTYTIEIIGKFILISMSASPDKQKLIEINQFGFSTTFHISAFQGCSNLIVKTTDTINLNSNQGNLFAGIKGFDSAVNLSTWDFSRVSGAAYIFNGVQNPMTSVPQGFITMANIDRLYKGSSSSL